MGAGKGSARVLVDSRIQGNREDSRAVTAATAEVAKPRARPAYAPAMAPDPSLPEPERAPPRGVPRWLWPPPGAVVRRVVFREETSNGGALYFVVGGDVPERFHLHAIQWLCAEYARDEAGPPPPAVVDTMLEIARTTLPAGRVGHAYALNGQALGAPGNLAARGALWRYARFVLGNAPDADPAGAPDEDF